VADNYPRVADVLRVVRGHSAASHVDSVKPVDGGLALATVDRDEFSRTGRVAVLHDVVDLPTRSASLPANPAAFRPQRRAAPPTLAFTRLSGVANRRDVLAPSHPGSLDTE
jgi:hypothetical protein